MYSFILTLAYKAAGLVAAGGFLGAVMLFAGGPSGGDISDAQQPDAVEQTPVEDDEAEPIRARYPLPVLSMVVVED